MPTAAHPLGAHGFRRRGAQALARGSRRQALAARRLGDPPRTPRPTVLQGARGHGHNDFKIPLLRGTLLAAVLAGRPSLREPPWK
jgi:hypothetical protein